jgi:hypothetical protein
MDTGRFDALTRVLATAGTRRRAVAGLAAAAAAVVLGDGAVSAAKCSRGKKRCGKKCISRKACCVKGKQIPEGGEYRQCGICIGGNVVKDPVACVLIDPDGCTDCQGGSFACVPAPDGTLCKGCGACDGGLCGDPDETRACGDACCSALRPVCVDAAHSQCCAADKACGTACCKADSGLGLQDGEVCTRDGCCLQVKAASNCRADQPNCGEKICCAAVWTQEGRGLTCLPGAGTPPGTRGYCCGPGKSCCFTGCCPSGTTCCGDGMCCPSGDGCGSGSCFAPTPDHV